MLFLYFTALGIGAGIIFILFLKDSQRNQRIESRDLLTKINKISKKIDDWEKKLDHFFLAKFENPLVVTKVENPFSSPDEKKDQDTLEEKTFSENLNSMVIPPAIKQMTQVDEQNEQIDWQTKYQKLEILCFEKNTMLEKFEKALENEIKNRQEFNVLKDILEAQLEKNKEKSRQLQAELISLRNENEEYQSKIVQFENQILPKQKIIQEQEKKINDFFSPAQNHKHLIEENHPNKTTPPDLIYLTSGKINL